MFSRSWSEGKNLIISHNFAGMERRIECALKHILFVINRLSFPAILQMFAEYFHSHRYAIIQLGVQ